jgi:hypothetical protein
LDAHKLFSQPYSSEQTSDSHKITKRAVPVAPFTQLLFRYLIQFLNFAGKHLMSAGAKTVAAQLHNWGQELAMYCVSAKLDCDYMI